MRRFYMHRCFVVLVMCLGGCSTTYNAATGRNEFIFISTASEVNMGRQVAAELAQKNKFSINTQDVSRLQQIGQRMARVADRQEFPYHFFLIEDDQVNAFTIPGGYIYIYTGLYRRLESDDAIAAVLGHEIGHTAAKHTVKKFQSALGYNVVKDVFMRVVAARLPQAQAIAGLGADGLMSLATSAYGRQDEYEADRLGIKYLFLAGFDPQAMLKVFDVLEATEKAAGGKVPVMLRTHPLAKDRVVAAQKAIAEGRKSK